MSDLLLDSTVLIDFLRGRPATRNRLATAWESGVTTYVCAISVEEVVRNLRPSEEEPFRRLLAGLFEAPLGTAEGERSGVWRRSLARKGRTIPQSDALIAAAAVGVGAAVATGNPKDFPMRDISVVHWPVNE